MVNDRWSPRRISLLYKFYRRAHLCMKEEKLGILERQLLHSGSLPHSWCEWYTVHPTFLPAGESCAFAISFQAVSAGISPHNTNIAIAWIWWAVSPVFTSNYRPLKPQKNFICQCPSVLKIKAESSTTNSHARQRVIFSIHLLNIFI